MEESARRESPHLGKVALVTGSGSRRVGNVVARVLAERGFAVALHYRRSQEDAEATVAELGRAQCNVAAFQADLTRENEVERLFQQVVGQFGRLDVLVTTASIWEPQPLETTTAEHVRRHFEANTLSTFLCCQHAGRIMVAQSGGGTIVTMGDWATERPYRNYAAYFASKGAIASLTRVFAVELAARNPNVRVNCILPGPVMLPDHLPPDEVQEAVAGTLLRRRGRPEHVAHAVLFLVENDYVTGVCLPVDGGRTIAGS